MHLAKRVLSNRLAELQDGRLFEREVSPGNGRRLPHTQADEHEAEASRG
ncbi:hypothetical protein [Streptomyces sp. NPDC058683]